MSDRDMLVAHMGLAEFAEYLIALTTTDGVKWTA